MVCWWWSGERPMLLLLGVWTAMAMGANQLWPCLAYVNAH